MALLAFRPARTPSRLRRLAVLGAVVAAAVVSTAVALATTAGPDVTPVWAQASEITLPTGATIAAGAQSAALNGLACTSPGTCVAVGEYADANGSRNDQPMAANESDGTWGVAQKITLPNDASTTSDHQFAALYNVACTSPGNCVAVGSYEDTNGTGDYLALYVTETNGVWGTAQTVSLPAGWNTTASGQDAYLDGVTCTSAGNCVAVGTYDGNNGSQDEEAMVVTETNGAWAAATELPLPTGYDTTPGRQQATLNAVTCTSPGNCVAVGNYNDPSTGRVMVATETSGTWSAVNEPVLPTNAAPTTTYNGADALDAVTCTSPGNCVALGSYEDTGGDGRAMATVETQGVWAPATEVTLPGNASSTGNAAFIGVTCTSPGDCVAAGYYEDTNGTSDYQAIFVDETRGVWGSATEVALPNGASTAPSGQSAEVDGISCTSPGVCVSVGQYADTNGSGDYQAMVVSSEPQLTLATTSLPAAVVGSPYDAQLAATGGVGSYSWSLTEGSLPAGLSLDAATGVISGMPTAVATGSVTVAASDPGLPAQTASVALPITVTGPGLVGVKIKSPKLTATVSCSEAAGATCSGPLELTAVEHLTGGKLTAVSARKRPKRTTRTVLLASKTYAVAGGTSATVTLKLGQVGAKLLAKYRTIHAELTLDVGKITITSEAVTIKRRAAHAA
jgi:hypothetical protein